MGHPGNPKAPEVAKAIEGALAQIVAAGKTPGMPATAEALQIALASGVRYIYTHLPAILRSGASAYFRNARPSG
jgi:2-keto-3-deoxy-L-rhamnonate aldolase RhmA